MKSDDIERKSADIERARAIIREWDDGLLSMGSAECMLHDIFLDDFLKSIENGSGYMRTGSCCCRSHPPERVFKIQFTITAHGFEAKPIKS